MNILTLDLGTQTGWAAHVSGVTVSGTQSFQAQRFSGGGMRYLRFRTWLAETISDQKIEAVFYEEVRRHIGTTAAHVYGGFLAVLTAYCEEHNIPYEGVPVGTIKKLATGKGNANKEAMIEAAKHRWPEQDIADDNQADALWILAFAVEAMRKGGAE
jgi:Holliday junction resolvasome RuvABC endonuclease subunit